MNSSLAPIAGHAKQARTLTDLWLGGEGKSFNEATAQAVVGLAEWNGVGDYEKVPLTLLSQLLIPSAFDDGKAQVRCRLRERGTISAATIWVATWGRIQLAR